MAAARYWLPPLADEPVGVLASWVVAVLVGAAGASVGIQAYDLARALNDSSAFFSSSDSEAIAYFAANALHLGGLLLGLAAVVYLLAMRQYGSARQE
jgi:hypothetical protein